MRFLMRGGLWRVPRQFEDVGTGAVAAEEGFAIKVGAEECVLSIAVLKALVAVDCAIFVCVDVL